MQETGESRDEGRWRSIIQSAVDGIVLIEARGRILARYLSTRERRIIGIGREVSGLRKDGSV